MKSKKCNINGVEISFVDQNLDYDTKNLFEISKSSYHDNETLSQNSGKLKVDIMAIH
jgi:hypothetical protein